MEPTDEAFLAGASTPTNMKAANLTHEAVPLPATILLPEKEETSAGSTVYLQGRIQ
jgi:hypothetical protein